MKENVDAKREGRRCKDGKRGKRTRMHSFIPRTNETGGWVTKTWKKMWMRKRGRRKKREGQKYNQPPAHNQTSMCASGSGFGRRHSGYERGVGHFSPVLLRFVRCPSITEYLTQSCVAASRVWVIVSSNHLDEHSFEYQGPCAKFTTRLTEKTTAFTRARSAIHFNSFTRGADVKAVPSRNDQNSCLCSEKTARLILKSSVKPENKLPISRAKEQNYSVNDSALVTYPTSSCDNSYVAKHSCFNGYFHLTRLLTKLLPRRYQYHLFLKGNNKFMLDSTTIATDDTHFASNLRQLGHDATENKFTAVKPDFYQPHFGESISQGKSFNGNTKRNKEAFLRVETGRRSQKRFFLNQWLVCCFLALLGSTSAPSTFNIFCQATAAPSSPLAPLPSYSSSPSTFSARSLSSAYPARYRLVHPSQTNESIFIYFNPPSIKNLRVNTRQKVSFNFTVRHQGAVVISSSSSALQSTTSISSISTATGSRNGNNHKNEDINTNKDSSNSGGNVKVAFNDAAGNAGNDQQLTTTGATASNTNTSSNNLRHYFAASEPNEPFWPNKSRLNEGQKQYQQRAPKASPSLLRKRQKTSAHREKYRVMIYSDNDIIARPLVSSPGKLAVVRADARGRYILMDVTAGRMHNFSVEARHIGRVTMTVAVVDVDGDRTMPMASYAQAPAASSQYPAVTASQYPVVAIRGERTADLVFNIAAAAIAIIISFGIGAVTETDKIKRQLKYPVALIVGFCCQFILMPVVRRSNLLHVFCLPVHRNAGINEGRLAIMQSW
ncbi:sodium/bile acid cotransporter 5-like [Plakobranchus ocellatus]|uniref:Sodium/bile acid cotransporter 5-like n=1 Tax=Plakobranchus ocellatus TaxID=259542 RepID=A0AAV3YIN5_9GAST|nr:sodium/bile acid cotransporter 5-like [Plakobranchus ocellatus]